MQPLFSEKPHGVSPMRWFLCGAIAAILLSFCGAGSVAAAEPPPEVNKYLATLDKNAAKIFQCAIPTGKLTEAKYVSFSKNAGKVPGTWRVTHEFHYKTAAGQTEMFRMYSYLDNAGIIDHVNVTRGSKDSTTPCANSKGAVELAKSLAPIYQSWNDADTKKMVANEDAKAIMTKYIKWKQ
jgi:hypothetical protein